MKQTRTEEGRRRDKHTYMYQGLGKLNAIPRLDENINIISRLTQPDPEPYLININKRTQTNYETETYIHVRILEQTETNQ